jgi:hypothetical protein
VANRAGVTGNLNLNAALNAAAAASTLSACAMKFVTQQETSARREFGLGHDRQRNHHGRWRRGQAGGGNGQHRVKAGGDIVGQLDMNRMWVC